MDQVKLQGVEKLFPFFHAYLTASKLAVIILDIVSMLPATVVLFSHRWRVVSEISVTVITVVTRHELLLNDPGPHKKKPALRSDGTVVCLDFVFWLFVHTTLPADKNTKIYSCKAILEVCEMLIGGRFCICCFKNSAQKCARNKSEVLLY